MPILFVVGAWQDSLRDGMSGTYAAGAATEPLGARRRRSRVWVAAGIAAVLFVAGFFLFIARRDSSTLKTGDQTTGQIVGEIRAAGWNPLDGGRLVVRYTIHGETRTSQIWLDNELTDYSIGENVTLLVRGRHVRTARESNDPAPWGAAALLLGVAGLGAIGRGLALRRPKRQWTPFMSDGQVVVPLAAWGFAPRKPTLYVDSTETRLFVPGYFGSHRMVVPTADVGVHVIPVESSDGDAEPEIWFEEGVRFLDLPTKWEFSYATLMLVFREPVRVPPIRWLLLFNNPLPIGWRASRSPEGEHVDAVLLRCPEPDTAADLLVGVGAQRVDDPVEWLAARRRTAGDPHRIAELRQKDDAARRASRVALLGWGAAWVLGVVARVTDDLDLLAGVLVAVGVAIAVPRLLMRRSASHRG